MILVLTYHKVQEAAGRDNGFYTVTRERLEQQLERLAQRGLEALTPDRLLEPRTLSSPASLLTFDDGTRGHFEVVLPILARHARRAIFFVPTAKLDRPGYLTRQQLREISQAGHTIGLHSHEHRRLDRMREPEVREQMRRSKEILGEMSGAPPVMFAPPGGFINPMVRAIALEAGVRVIRTMRWGYNEPAEMRALDCIPLNRYSSEREFEQVLKCRRRTFLYAAKEMTKKLMPEQGYALLRRALMGLRRRG